MSKRPNKSTPARRNRVSRSVERVARRTGPRPASPDRAYEQQKLAFEGIPARLLKPYAGQYIASVNGRIMDSDRDLPTLTRRFFGDHGHVPVYVGFAGRSPVVVIDTPF